MSTRHYGGTNASAHLHPTRPLIHLQVKGHHVLLPFGVSLEIYLGLAGALADARKAYPELIHEH